VLNETPWDWSRTSDERLVTAAIRGRRSAAEAKSMVREAIQLSRSDSWGTVDQARAVALAEQMLGPISGPALPTSPGDDPLPIPGGIPGGPTSPGDDPYDPTYPVPSYPDADYPVVGG
jgi:hypothetical protein